jgi:muconolactone delta-isomerase
MILWNKMAVKIQKVWRGVLGRRRVRRIRAELADIRRRQLAAIGHLQRLWRGEGLEGQALIRGRILG